MDEIDPNIYRLMRPAMVCLCRHVSADRLISEIKNGATTFEELQKRTRCSTVCGNCEPKVRKILADELEKLAKNQSDST
ncbi:MAG: (2Fe-2S)-binding protein [Leptonema sp. (in: Bacteria)]|nr:(2Fe-2S)-binding protein [Leptonema sp. (in: bacteria)]